MSDDFLEHLLAESLSGRIVQKHELLREHELHAIHAACARWCREQRSFTLVPVEREENGLE